MSHPNMNAQVVDSAIDELQRLTGREGGGFEWELKHYYRRRGTVWRLTDKHTHITMFYKEIHSAHQSPGSIDSIGNRLHRTPVLTRSLIDRLAFVPIFVPPVLAVDPEKGIIVTLGVGGHEVRRSRLMSRLAASEHDYASLLGLACAEIELVGQSTEGQFDFDLFRSNTDRRLAHSGLTGPNSRVLHDAMLGLAENAVSRSGLSFVHGDLSHSNILVKDQGDISLIDFGWVSRFKGFDLGLLSYRLTHSTRLRHSVSSEFVKSMLLAYRTAAAGNFDIASLHLVDKVLLVRGLRSRSPLLRSKAKKTLTRLGDRGVLGADTLLGQDQQFQWSWI